MTGRLRTRSEAEGRGRNVPSNRARRSKSEIPRFPLKFKHWALAPLIIFLILFLFYPLLELLRMGFSTASLGAGQFQWQFTGLTNFRTMLQDEIFRVALVHTLIFVTVAVALEVILGTILALMVVRARWLAGIARNVLVWPVIITPVAISVTWWLILNTEFGVLNYVLEAIGLPQQAWLSSTTWALPTLIGVDVWHWTPLLFLLVLAGLANIDPTLYEVARTDGASGWQLFRYVTLPLLLPTIGTAAILRTILGFKVFDEIYLLTNGGPGIATEVISTYVHDIFFNQTRMGYGAFLGLVVVLVLLVLLLGYYVGTYYFGSRGEES